MNTQEAAALLAVAAAFDNRKPDADAAMAWAAALHDVRFEDARDAVVAHYRKSSDWLMPAMVTARVSEQVSARHRRFGPLIPPTSLEGDVDKEREWFQWAFAEVSSGRAQTPDDVRMDNTAHYKQRDIRELGIDSDAEPRRLANPVAHLRTLRDEATTDVVASATADQNEEQ
jgi:hypothetical protein